MEVRPPSSPRSLGMVCYSLAPDTPGPYVAEPASVIPDSTAAGPKARRGRAPRQVPPPSRQSARLALSRGGQEGPVLSIPEKAERRAAALALDSTPGTSRSSHPSPPAPSATGSRFSVLASVSLDHLGAVASDSGVVFRGERGPRLDQIAAIRAKEIYEGSLAAARALLEQERARDQEQAGPVPTAPGSGSTTSSRPGDGKDPLLTPACGGQRGGPSQSASRPSTSGRARSVPRKGTNPGDVSQ
jgi:hypothetical protein